MKFLKNKKILAYFTAVLRGILKLRFKILKKASFPNLDFQITTKCSLHCEQCSILIPFWKSAAQYTETFESFKTRLDNLLKNVDCIYRLQILGGEPFLNKELDKMIEYASKKKQIKAIMTITNSTILPDENLLSVYRKYHKKNYIAISDYRANSELKNLKIDKLGQILKENNISYRIDAYDWNFMGHIQKENRTKEKLIQIKNKCYQQGCHAYYNGIIYLCSRIAGMRMSFDENIGTGIDGAISDYVQVTADDCSQEIIKLFCKRYFDACDYCHIDPHKKISPAVQVKNEGNL